MYYQYPVSKIGKPASPDTKIKIYLQYFPGDKQVVLWYTFTGKCDEAILESLQI